MPVIVNGNGFVSGIPYTVTVLTSGSGTYTTPSGCVSLWVRMVGGGGGGGGGGSSGATNGGTGGTTTFGTSLLTCNGGTGGYASNDNPTAPGGTATIGAGASGIAFKGATGGMPQILNVTGYGFGGYGGVSPFGGGGMNGHWDQNGASCNAQANTGSGGGGGPAQNVGGQIDAGEGGGAGGYIEAIISSPSATYSYAVGAGGTAGGAGTNGGAGGTGAAGVIIIYEYYG